MAKEKDQIVDLRTPEERKVLAKKRLAKFLIAVDIILIIFVAIQAVLIINELLSK